MGGEELHDWLVSTRTFKRLQRADGGSTGVDEEPQHPRPSVEMEGGTVFHFVTDGIHSALKRARDAAGDQDIRLLGGAAVIRQYLQARALDEMHVAVSPILLGSGEHLLAGLDLPALGYRCAMAAAGEKGMHYIIERE